jgi:hypothetical protein
MRGVSRDIEDWTAMNWRMFVRALFLRGGIIWLVGTHHRVLPRRLPGPWFLPRWATKINSKRQGRKDGKLGLPTVEQMSGAHADFPGHLMYLKNEGDRFVRAVLEAMLSADTKKGGRSAAIGQVRQLISHAMDDRSALEDFERSHRASKTELSDRERQLKENQDALAAAKKKRRSVDAWSRGLPRRTYLALLAALTVAELPLLALAFQNFFSVALSLVVSVGVSVAIIFCAHVAGVLLNKRESVLLPGDTKMLMAIWGGVLATIVGLSFVRELYLKTTGQAEGTSTGPTWVVVVVFAVFNAMVFGAAVLVSKFKHSEYAEDIDDGKRAVRTSRREIKRARKHEKNVRKVVMRVQDRIVLLEGLASNTAHRARTSVVQARLVAAQRKDFIEKCYSLYARENSRSQASWATRRARLRPPPESRPLPMFNRLPEVKDPDVEFAPFEAEVNHELIPLEALLARFEPVRASRTKSGKAVSNGARGPAPQTEPADAP